MRVGITGAFAVLENIGDGRRLFHFRAEKELCVVNTYFMDKNLHKYTRLARGQNKVEVMSILDLVLVKKDLLHYV